MSIVDVSAVRSCIVICLAFLYPMGFSAWECLCILLSLFRSFLSETIISFLKLPQDYLHFPLGLSGFSPFPFSSRIFLLLQNFSKSFALEPFFEGFLTFAPSLFFQSPRFIAKMVGNQSSSPARGLCKGISSSLLV